MIQVMSAFCGAHADSFDPYLLLEKLYSTI